MKTLWIDYTNHRGERRLREIIPSDTYCGSTPYHPEEQWILQAKVADRGYATRYFAMKDIHGTYTSLEDYHARRPLDNDQRNKELAAIGQWVLDHIFAGGMSFNGGAPVLKLEIRSDFASDDSVRALTNRTILDAIKGGK